MADFIQSLQPDPASDPGFSEHTSMPEPHLTDRYYRDHAQAFIQLTRDLNLSPLYAPFLEHVPPGGQILDAGCGSGRDSLYFRQIGYRVMALDAGPEFVEQTRQYAGVEARCQRMEELDEAGAYDGIWACASLLHFPSPQLPDVLERLGQALKPAGVLYVSFKYGAFEGQRDGRHFTDMDEARLQRVMASLPQLEVIRIWDTPNLRPDRGGYWLNGLIGRR